MSDDTAHSSPEHHAKTLVRGGRPLPPRLLYMGMQSLDALLFSSAYTIYGLYAVKAAALGPLELTLVGTIMELAIFHNPQRIVQILLAFTVVMLLATLLFALAGVFWLGLFAVWMTRWMRIAMRPLVLAWANRGLAPYARATVLSMLSQAEALGEVCGGPLLGLVGTLHTVRTALVGAALVLLPALPLYSQALRHNKQQEAWPAA